MVEPAAFEAARAQLEENRRHKREGRRRPGWLLQGLVVCRRCGYAFYGKMARGRVGGRQVAEYGYYRCLGTDAHRFGGVAVCDNRSVRSDRLELAVWDEIRALLEGPGRLAAEYRRRLNEVRAGTGDRDQAAALNRQIAGLRRGIGRLIDGYAGGGDRARRVPAPHRRPEGAALPCAGAKAGAHRSGRGRTRPGAGGRPGGGLGRQGAPRARRTRLAGHARHHP